MKEIWTEREAEFHGEFVRFDKIWVEPKPLQKPHPPVIIGGDGPTKFDRVVELRRRVDADPAPAQEPGGADSRVARAAPDGRARPEVGAGVGLFRAAQADGARRAGSGRRRPAIFGLPPEPRDGVLPRLDAYAAVMRG